LWEWTPNQKILFEVRVRRRTGTASQSEVRRPSTSESTSVDVVTTYHSAVRKLIANKATFVRNATVHAAIIDIDNFQILKIGTNSTSSSPESGNFVSRLMKDNPALFYGVIVGGFALIIAVLVLGLWCVNRKKR
jgi:hypothetical protein